jgi:hypothetical protein
VVADPSARPASVVTELVLSDAGSGTVPGGGSSLFDLLTLRRTRALVRERRGRTVAVGIGLTYAVIALFAGYMLEVVPTGASGLCVSLLTNPYSPAWWNYPALLVVAPQGVLVLPFFTTIAMVAVSAGVGLGMGAGLLLAIRFFRSWKLARAGRPSASSLVGITPAMVALLTLGACCSTSAAAAGGIGAIAVASGTTYNEVLLNSWYLNVFQIAVLAIALVAQEQLIAVYQSLPGPRSESVSIPAAKDGSTRTGVRAVKVVLRFALVVAGTLWMLSWLLVWASPPPGEPATGLLVGGLVQHGLVGGAAVAAGLLPGVVAGTSPKRGVVRAVRVLLFASGASVIVGVPPPLSTWGIYGLGNVLLSSAGAPASLGGGVSIAGGDFAAFMGLAALCALPGLFSIIIATHPARVLRWLSVRGGDRPARPHDVVSHRSAERDAQAPMLEG